MVAEKDWKHKELLSLSVFSQQKSFRTSSESSKEKGVWNREELRGCNDRNGEM